MTTRSVRALTLCAAALLATACTESISGTQDVDVLDNAFTSTPLGFEAASSSFAGFGMGSAFMPGHSGSAGMRGPRGANGLPGGHDFMGGGFGLDFMGGLVGGGRPFEHGGVPSNCVFAAATGLITCPTVSFFGMTMTSTFSLKNAAGTAQPAFDSTTNSVNSRVEVSGSVTRRDGAQTAVSHRSDRTVTGLAKGSTRRTVNGTSAGSESTSGRDSSGTFAVARTIGDTTTGLTIPIGDSRVTYPIAGSVLRSMRATVTRSTGATTSARREVITYDGSATAKLVITRDGTTKNCTIALPRGRPVCS